jgi:hypothetical protein
MGAYTGVIILGLIIAALYFVGYAIKKVSNENTHTHQ